MKAKASPKPRPNKLRGLAKAGAASALLGMVGAFLVASSGNLKELPAGSQVEINTVCSGVHLGDGLMLTAAHCVGKGEQGVATDKGEWFSSTLLWTNTDYDVALYAAEIARAPIRRAELACRDLVVDEQVILAGSPLGEHFIRTRGVVLGPKRKYDDMWAEGVIVDITIGHGSSGGPLFDLEGKIVGLGVGYHRGYRFGIVVPSSTICRLLARA